MICLLQRVKKAKVVISEQTVGQIETGLLVFVCAESSDSPQTIDKALSVVEPDAAGNIRAAILEF
uniref:D-aminoacyl-tRNA deacylase n=1 Tax=uncultured Paenalcaligenes sp. TaxID=1588925 RepID=UPI002609D9EC